MQAQLHGPGGLLSITPQGQKAAKKPHKGGVQPKWPGGSHPAWGLSLGLEAELVKTSLQRPRTLWSVQTVFCLNTPAFFQMLSSILLKKIYSTTLYQFSSYLYNRGLFSFFLSTQSLKTIPKQRQIFKVLSSCDVFQTFFQTRGVKTSSCPSPQCFKVCRRRFAERVSADSSMGAIPGDITRCCLQREVRPGHLQSSALAAQPRGGYPKASRARGARSAQEAALPRCHHTRRRRAQRSRGARGPLQPLPSPAAQSTAPLS